MMYFEMKGVLHFKEVLHLKEVFGCEGSLSFERGLLR